MHHNIAQLTQNDFENQDRNSIEKQEIEINGGYPFGILSIERDERVE